jgi:DNA polymerase (family 10)
MSVLISKKDVVCILEEIAVLLELKGESPFKAIAYANAARRLESIGEDLHDLVRRGGLSSLKGIGDALEKKITELVTTGHLEYYEKLQAFPRGTSRCCAFPAWGRRRFAPFTKSSP